MQRIVVDTDMGVDDAAAVAWLLTQADHEVELLGIAAVWGNTEVESAAANAVALLRVLGREGVRVLQGAGAPLAGARSRVGELVHGTDGLWGRAAETDRMRAERDVISFYRAVADEGATLLALGPLTNLAVVARKAPGVIRRFARIVVLGGAKHHGSMTPVSETNFWHDPEAADAVLSARLPITLLTRDAHRAFALTAADLSALAGADTPAARFLAAPMAAYAEVTQRFGEALSFPDVVAAVYALDEGVAAPAAPALVRVVTGANGLTRGQSIIGLTVNERLSMIGAGAALDELVQRSLADPALDLGAHVASILAREPDNARVVLEIDAARVRTAFMAAMTRRGA
jgi:purine nucleosidase